MPLEVVRHGDVDLLREALGGPAPSLTLVLGPDEVARASLLRRALLGLDAVRYWAAPLPDADQRALFTSRLGRWGEARPAHAAQLEPAALSPQPITADADWPRIFEHLLARANERDARLRLVLEEFPRLVEARPKLLHELERFWAGARARGLPVHLVLAGEAAPVFERMESAEDTWAAWIGRVIRMGPLTYREVGRLFPSYAPRERLIAWSVFGGLGSHLRHCDPEVSLARNVRQALLSPASPLLGEGIEQLQRRLQSVGRYASLLRSLAFGRREWREVLAGTPQLASGGQMAPYLTRLQRLGLVSGVASLDARPQARSRRYQIVDPFVWFWYRFVLPSLTDLLDGRTAEVWRRWVRPRLDEHAATLFPMACREHLSHHAHERLTTNAREVGALWGPDYDIEVAGTLRTGAAVYGKVYWGKGRITEEADETLEQEMRRTRYGFGRETRLRLLYSSDGFSPALLRRGARSEGLHLIGPAGLFGE